ncbi:MAG: hypothetical protein DMG54_03665 [Acidobacteria bacterium]|nr:MAG: hypothetical protein DMG54_03665 [Acidobacteriota bacterium]PYU48397.1 MAG: hypothetical protein DMG53_06785 [Acidobacteriota bacterium]PYU77240.1 MAG: hypothetical protein DMG52_01330 [Acidobacteriota bacterium]
MCDEALRFSGGKVHTDKNLTFLLSRTGTYNSVAMLNYPQREPVFICPRAPRTVRSSQVIRQFSKATVLARIGLEGSQVQFDWKLHLQRI